MFVQVFGDLCVVSYWIDTLVLKLREILTLLCYITLSSSREKPTQAKEVARRISGAVSWEAYAKVIYQVPITNPYPSHYIYLPPVFLSPTSKSILENLCLFFAPLLFNFFACFLCPCVLYPTGLIPWFSN